MLFPSTASLSALISWSRSLRHMLSAGIPIVRVFRQQSQKGPRELRPVAARISDDLEKGESLEDCLEREQNHFPPLFRELATIGERTGHLPEMFRELEEYYSLQQTLRRQFYSQITWPVFQFFAAVLVIALLIWILGMIAEGRGGEPMEPIGLGLSGGKGAVIFLIGVGVILALLFGFYKLMTRGFKQRAAFSAFLLRLPAIGPCVEALAMMRFCISFRMTLETAMPVDQAMRLTLRSTANAGFSQYEEVVVASVKHGEEVADALSNCPLFPREFIEVVHVGEVSGQLPESMIRQAAYYREEAERRMRTLTKVAGIGVWMLVAIFIIVAIFRIATMYLGAINNAANGL